MEEDKKIKIVKSVTNNIGYILTVVIVLGFVLSGLIIPGIKQTDIWLILVSSGLMLGSGITLNMILPIQALIDGERHESVTSAKQRVNETYMSIKDKTQYIDAYVDVKNKEAIKSALSCFASIFSLLISRVLFLLSSSPETDVFNIESTP